MVWKLAIFFAAFAIACAVYFLISGIIINLP